jgi:hypothetical protein
MARQGWAGQGKARQGKARQGSYPLIFKREHKKWKIQQ